MNDLPEQLFAISALDRLLATIKERSEAFETEMDAAPQTQACPKHGELKATLNREASMRGAKIAYTCADCEHEAFLARSLKRIEAAGIPADVRHATFDNFDVHRPAAKIGDGMVGPDRFLEKACLFAAGDCRNIIFAGTPGIGKGHLAAAICIQAIFRGRSVLWVECAKLFTAYHKSYKDDSTSEVIDRHVRASLLVLDEICLRDLPSDGEEILFAIIDGRQKAGRQTIMLGNKTAKETRDWLGGRISDRLRSGKVAFCYGEWESMRGQQGDGASNEF